MNRYKPVGWRNESYRHSLAAKGVKTRKISFKAHDYVEFSQGKKWYSVGIDDKKEIGKISKMPLFEVKKKYKGRIEVADSEKKLHLGPVVSMAGKSFNFGNDAEYRRFKKAYLEAKERGDEQFDWDGQPVLVDYAKYALEYAEGERERRGMSIYKKSMAGKGLETGQIATVMHLYHNGLTPDRIARKLKISTGKVLAVVDDPKYYDYDWENPDFVDPGHKKSMAWKETEDLKELAREAKAEFKRDYAEAKGEAKYEILTKQIMRMERDLAQREADIKDRPFTSQADEPLPHRLKSDVMDDLRQDIDDLEKEVSAKKQEKVFAEQEEEVAFQKVVPKKFDKKEIKMLRPKESMEQRRKRAVKVAAAKEKVFAEEDEVYEKLRKEGKDVEFKPEKKLETFGTKPVIRRVGL